jgi:hypothetical protein
MPTIFQPYIMALISDKTIVLDVDDEMHRVFRSFKNKRSILEWEDSPLAELLSSSVDTAAGEGTSIWVPPKNYFAPYFARLDARLKESVAQIC